MFSYDPISPYQNGDGASHPLSRIDRFPPHNLEAEKGVLASVILDNAAMHEVAPILKAKDFYRADHAELYGVILGLYDAGKPFDVLIIAETMRDRYKAIGGDLFMVEIVGSVPHSANAKYYAQIVHQKAIGRDLIEAANEILREGYANEFTAEQLVESAEQKVFAISEAEATGETVTVTDVVTLAMERVEQREGGEVTGICMGFPDVDDMTDGFQPGNLIILAARPSMGKSAIAMNMADYVATETGVSTLFVSLEMSRLEIGERFLSARAKVDTARFKNPEALSLADRVNMGKAYDELRKSRLFIDDTPHRTLTQIAANARRLRTKHNLGLLIIDYIQLIDGQRLKGESRQEEVARVSKRLKGIAREIHLPVIALAQLNRQSENREDRRPRLSDLRESGQLEADADVVLLLHRPEYYDPNDRPGEAELIVAKNRNGATGPVRLTFLKHCTRFASFAPPGLQEPIDGVAF